MKEITEGDLAGLLFTKARYLLSILCFQQLQKITIRYSYILLVLHKAILRELWITPRINLTNLDFLVICWLINLKGY